MSKESDTVLSWLNTSISDAIHKKYLAAIDLSISLTPDSTNVTESYFFQIKYNDATGESVVLSDDVVLSPTQLSKMHVFKMMKKLILLTQSLAPLPTNRYLHMRLLFNDSTPKDYTPEHFVDCSNEKAARLSVPVKLVDELKADCGVVNSVHHTVSSKFISLCNLEKKDLVDDVVDVDVFDLFKDDEEEDDVKEEDDINTNININTQVSQVTKDLYDMLKNYNHEIHDGETQVADSLTDTNINCTCGSTMYLPYSSTTQCNTCFNNMHKVCYALNENNNFTCYNCANDSTVSEHDMQILFCIRKLIAYFQESNKNIMKSITDAAKIIGFESNYASSPVIDAISVLIFEGIISLKPHKSFNHTIFNVDVKGLLVDNKQIQTGKYYISFVQKNTKDKITQFIDPNFGKFHQVFDSLNINDDNFNETTVVDDEYDISITQQPKKKKISKSYDILNI